MPLGWLIGDWEMDAVVHADDGTTHSDAAKSISAGCSRAAPSRMSGSSRLFYGTTLRVYDPGLDAWHILWSDPVKQFYTRQIGRRAGKDIVQEGTAGDGAAVRWSFTEIEPDSFRTGSASARATAARAGSSRWISTPAACRSLNITQQKEPMIKRSHLAFRIHDIARAQHLSSTRRSSRSATPASASMPLARLWARHHGPLAPRLGPAGAPDEVGPACLFRGANRASVDTFHATALAADGPNNSRPGLRADYGASYYAASRRPDGSRSRPLDAPA